MKLIILTFLIVTTFCLIQAHHLRINLITYYDDIKPTNGTIIVTLNGDTMKKVIKFENMKLFEFNYTKTEIDFPEDVQTVTVHYESDSKKFIFSKMLKINRDDIWRTDFFMMFDNIESGTSKTFKKLIPDIIA